MATQLLRPPLVASSLSTSSSSLQILCFSFYHYHHHHRHRHLGFQSAGVALNRHRQRRRKRRSTAGLVFVGAEDTELRVQDAEIDPEVEEDDDPSPEDLEYVGQIKRVLELLKKNRDMFFSEVKLTIMIEDPREVERKRLLGIEDSDGPTREELADVLEEVNEGKIPKNRFALQLLAEEMIQWPNLEVEASKKKPTKSLYAKATDTGIDPRVAAKRLNIDWDSAAEIEDADDSDDTEVPSAVGYGALYLVTGFPVIIGISVVLILFYNSLQ